MLKIVYKHSQKWRYYFIPKKSAVLVYGENANEGKLNAKYHVFRLGKEQIHEQQEYDHLGLKNCINPSNSSRVIDKIKKGKKHWMRLPV